MDQIYLDYNATTPLDPEVVKAVTEALSLWGNPSSPYEVGKKAKGANELARSQIAKMLNAKPSDVVFSSGGTESNNHVIWSVLESFKDWSKRNGKTYVIPHVVTTNVEHVAVGKPLKYWQEQGKLELTIVPVDPATGRVAVDAIMHAIRPHTILVSVMMANNETGVIMPLEEIGFEIGRLKTERNGSFPLYFHTDAAQAIGKVEVDVDKLGVDFLVVVGHKFYAPRIGALYVRGCGDETELYPMFFGGGQERGFRSGTENNPMIVGLGKAAELVTNGLLAHKKHLEECRTELEKRLKELFGEKVQFNFENTPRLPNTTSVLLHLSRGSGYELLQCCPIVNASTGSACHNGAKPSAVLMASGLTESQARCTLRLTVGRFSTIDGVRRAAVAIHEGASLFM